MAVGSGFVVNDEENNNNEIGRGLSAPAVLGGNIRRRHSPIEVELVQRGNALNLGLNSSSESDSGEEEIVEVWN